MKVVDIAVAELGVTENPPQSNQVKYNTWYYGREVSGRSYPWCMVFVQWVFAQAGETLPARTASCGALMRAAQMSGQWVTEDYRPGDVVIYDFPGGAATDHCGIVEKVTGGSVVAIEGNTGSGSDADGGQVQRRTRSLSCVVGAYRAKGDEEVTQEQFNRMMEVYLSEKAAEAPSQWSAEARKWAESNGVIQGDGTGGMQYKSPCTREQMVVFLARLAELISGGRD